VWFNQILAAYNFYKNGFMPHVGGIVDQAALYPFVMATIDDAISYCEKAPKRSEDSLLDRKNTKGPEFKESGPI